jgi:putative ABC transport system permease protein
MLVARFLANFHAAFRSLREQYMRALLSGLGIMVGSFAIVLLISIAKGVQKDLSDHVEDLGVNLLIVLPFRMEEGSFLMPNAAGLSHLRTDDLERVRQVDGVVRAAPLTFAGGGIRYGEKTSPTTFIIAAGSDWFQIRPVVMAEGQPFVHADETASVCVIGSVAKEQLFGDQPALNREVIINGDPYRIIGVTQDKKTEESLFSMGSFENVAYIPFPRLASNGEQPQLHRIMVQTAPDREPKGLVESVDAALAERLDRQMFSVATQEDLLKLIFKLMNILTWLLTGLTSVGLFVGGVGILAIMLMSVNERAKEIGIRKTVGATRSDIFSQFLTEAVALAMLGGTLGLLLSYAVCAALTTFTPIKPLITAGTIALSFGVSIGVGAIAGVIPAVAAARKDPVESLRRE